MQRPPTQRPDARQGGWTLIELLTALVIIGILMSMTMNKSQAAMLAAKNAQAAVEIMELMTAIDDYELENDMLPPTLAAIGEGGKLDPWGRAYVYEIITDILTARKDKFLVPVNTGYDLYSAGADGRSRRAFSAEVSIDDIVRAGDGSYVGLAAGY